MFTFFGAVLILLCALCVIEATLFLVACAAGATREEEVEQLTDLWVDAFYMATLTVAWWTVLV